MLKSIYLAAKLLWRDWRAGEWYVVFFALFLAVTASTAIHFYTDRLMRGLDEQGARFLGGDLVVSSAAPIPQAWIDYAQHHGLKTAQVWSYPSVVTADNHLQLVSLQAVSDTYPLLGNTVIQPQPLTAWVEPRLLPLLGIKLHGVLTIGAQNFAAAKLLTPDVDTLNTGWTIAPRVMIRLSDVPATRTVISGSRVDYRLLLVGNTAQIDIFKRWITPQLDTAQKLLDVKNQQSALQTILQRADSYLQLVLLICLLMSGVAIVISVQDYLRRHYSHVALWRCLGGGQRQIRLLLFWQLLMISIAAGLLGVFAGYLAQNLFVKLFQQYLMFVLPPAGLVPAISGLLTSVFLLFAFALPAMQQLPAISPTFIWRNETRVNVVHNDLYTAAFVLLVLLFVYWITGFSLLTLYFLSCMIISTAVLYVLSTVFLSLLRQVLKLTDGAIRRGISQLVQYPFSFSLQFIGFNLIIISLIVLGAVRNNIMSDWYQSLSPHTPNYFAINIALDDINKLNQLFARFKVPVEGIYPMVRGRLTALNGTTIASAVPADQLGHNALHRELNLSWMWQYPSDNKIVGGSAWTMQDSGKALVSVENKLAHDLGLHLGDQLTFQIGAQTISAVISNFRSVKWDSFHPNFFMIFPPGLLQQMPTTYITSFHLGADQTDVLNLVVQMFPSITVIDVASLLIQMQELVGKIMLAMEYLFGFALCVGVLIFIVCLQASMSERRKTYRLLRILGAGNLYIRKSVMIEFGCLLVFLLLSSVVFGRLVAYIIEQYILSL